MSAAGRPLRLLLLTTSLRVGGTERVVVELAQALHRSGRYDVRVACLEPEGPLIEPLRRAGIAVHTFGARGALAAPAVVWKLARTLRRERIELLQTFLFHANVLGCAAAALARAARWRGQVVTSIRTAQGDRLWRVRLERFASQVARCTICVSDAVRAFASDQLRLPATRLITIRNGVELGPPPEAPALTALADDASPPHAAPWVMVARLSPDKRHEDALAAWRILAARDDAPPPLHLVGGGPRLDELRRGAAGLPVRFLGERGDVRALLRSAAGLVMPASTAEGCPNAVLEAMAEGLPVVATDTPALRELVVEGRTGLLAQPGDPAALADAVQRLARQPALGARLGRAGRERVERQHSIEAMVSRYDAVYAHATGRNRLPGATIEEATPTEARASGAEPGGEGQRRPLH